MHTTASVEQPGKILATGDRKSSCTPPAHEVQAYIIPRVDCLEVANRHLTHDLAVDPRRVYISVY